MVENGNFGLFFASKLWDIVGLPWRPYFQIREAPRVQFSQKRDEEDNGEGIRETRWLIYCFAAFKAKLLQNSALRTSRCFRPFTILKWYIKICKDGFVQFTIMDISYFGTFGLNSASVEQHIVLWGTCPLPKSYFALFLSLLIFLKNSWGNKPYCILHIEGSSFLWRRDTPNEVYSAKAIQRIHTPSTFITQQI